ncbi:MULTISPECIES: 4Fe-4S cluster-binding domain-containing protein [unclassified Pasteurella]|uniref:4Fe-4S cluster-binding domain-containing protein n=1 Tax=unclassified Pasteurella TaxID=2621516 RepID=UPI0010734898|nr:4Fe-4S cluster-binding domain-containing protein [Pasteurella sp. 19428wF3_WM03]TFU49542.1 4Fe-4S cluster-binding domain-containing protein [Pasteurella sp. WM03]
MTALSMLDSLYVPLHRIIPFSNVEGQGNRTSIFLQGCKLNCLYCHNPETIPRYAEGVQQVSLRYLYEQVMEAVPFIRGVTISGGEPTLHHKKLIPLFNAFRAQGLSCYLDSSGFFDFERIHPLIEVTDKFLFDLKGEGLGLQTLCFDRKNREGWIPSNVLPEAQWMKNENLTRHLFNLSRLLPLNKVEEVRLVFVKDFFEPFKLINQIAIYLKPYPRVPLKIIRMHTRGARDEQGLFSLVPSREEIDRLADYAKKCGIDHILTIY